MSPSKPDEGVAPEKHVSMFKGGSEALERGIAGISREPLAQVRKDVADAMGSKNLAFLLGSGCSSARAADGTELGIPTMAPMAQSLLSGDALPQPLREELKDALGIDFESPDFSTNLERLMEVLYGFRASLASSVKADLSKHLNSVDEAIQAVKQHVLTTCLEGQESDPGRTVHATYEKFYRRLAQRDRALARPWVFTTNYDMFNETAMDRLGIPYLSGFQGSVERRFNPASFRYTIAEQLDISSGKWSSVDSLVYFAKLHGSLSWHSADEGLFPVQETAPRRGDTAERLLIYPTPAKQNASFSSPYSDMFREFQSRVARGQSVLVTVGYGFGDEHVNNIIFQALTIPTFRLVAFVDPSANKTVERLRALDDPRVWIVGTEAGLGDWKAHYFANFVEEFMPSSGEDPTDGAIDRVLTDLLGRHADGESASE